MVRKKGDRGADFAFLNKIRTSSGDGDEYKKKASQIGGKMMRVTGERVSMGIILMLILTVVFTYYEHDQTLHRTMITLHHIEHSGATNDTDAVFVERALRVGFRNIPGLCGYTYMNGTTVNLPPSPDSPTLCEDFKKLRRAESPEIRVCTGELCSVGTFDVRQRCRVRAYASMFLTLYIMLIWCMAVVSYALPVSALIVIPIERMVRFLGMLVKDPLGYQRTRAFHQFSAEEEWMLKETGWRKEVMDGMKT